MRNFLSAVFIAAALFAAWKVDCTARVEPTEIEFEGECRYIGFDGDDDDDDHS